MLASLAELSLGLEPIGLLAARLAAFFLPNQEGAQGDFVVAWKGGVQLVHISVFVFWFKTPLLAVHAGRSLVARPAPIPPKQVRCESVAGVFHPCDVPEGFRGRTA